MKGSEKILPSTSGKKLRTSESVFRPVLWGSVN